MKELKVRLTFLEEILGTASADPEIHETFIASNAPDAPTRKEEIEAIGIEEVVEKSMTVFPRDNGVPIYWDYQIKGFSTKRLLDVIRTANGYVEMANRGEMSVLSMIQEIEENTDVRFDEMNKNLVKKMGV